MNDIVMRSTEVVRKHLSDKYIGFTFTSDTVSAATGVSTKEVLTIINNLKRSGRVVKVGRNKKLKRTVYAKARHIEVFILDYPHKSGPRPKEYIKPDTESTWYLFNYGGVLRA